LSSLEDRSSSFSREKKGTKNPDRRRTGARRESERTRATSISLSLEREEEEEEVISVKTRLEELF
jgi:hypothetical protein